MAIVTPLKRSEPQAWPLGVHEPHKPGQTKARLSPNEVLTALLYSLVLAPIGASNSFCFLGSLQIWERI